MASYFLWKYCQNLTMNIYEVAGIQIHHSLRESSMIATVLYNNDSMREIASDIQMLPESLQDFDSLILVEFAILSMAIVLFVYGKMGGKGALAN